MSKLSLLENDEIEHVHLQFITESLPGGESIVVMAKHQYSSASIGLQPCVDSGVVLSVEVYDESVPKMALEPPSKIVAHLVCWPGSKHASLSFELYGTVT